LSQNQGIPGWAKALIAIAGVGAAIYIVYYAVTNVFSAGVNAYKQLYQQQYNALLQKMAGYIKANASSNTGFTASQQQAITQEERILQQTQQGLSAAANGLTNALMWTIIGVATAAVLGAVGASALKSFLQAKYGRNPASAYSYTYSVTRIIADELEQMGYPTQAANLITTAQQMFQTIDQPAMTEQIATLQTTLTTLVGAELLAAQQMISLLSTDMEAIPDILVTPIM
jgi:predicted PurR-regulated permease PerM